MQGVVIAGAGMTPFTRAPGTGVRELATRAATEALADAGIGNEAVRRIFFGNAAAASVTRQDMIRGQVAFRNLGLSKVPVVNVENACASGGSALMLGFESVASGLADVVLVVGAEQLSHDRKERTFAALHGAMDVDEIGEFNPHQQPAGGSSLMEGYATEGREYLEKYDADIIDFARVAVKNRWHATVNSRAHFRKPQNIEQVLADRAIAAPLTLSMCSPITDGAAALVLCSDDYAKRHGIDGPKILASEIAPGTGRGSAPLRMRRRKPTRRPGSAPRI